MMKRFILFCVAACLLACEDYEPEYLFDASPEERLDQIINDYSEVLTAPENGWIGFYTSVNNIGGFAVLLKFEKDGNVTIKNEAVGFANIAEKEESVPWRVDVTQHPELVFESACIFTEWQGMTLETASGYTMGGGEFQFVLESVKEDQIILRSKTDQTDITYLYLRRAESTDWDFRGMSDLSEDLINLETKSIVVNRKLVGDGLEKFVEFSGNKRYLIVEGELGEAALYRYAITRTHLVMLDTIHWGDKVITQLEYDGAAHTIKSSGDVAVHMEEVEGSAPVYLTPQFLPELATANPDVLTGPSWIWVDNPELSKVESLEVMLKNYDDFYGLEFLPNLKSLTIMGILNTDSKIDVSKNKKLRRLTVMLNLLLSDITLGNLEELEEVVFTSNPMMKEIDMRSCCKNLKDFRAHMCHPTDFRVNVSGAKNLTYFAAQQNGWKSLDITGCTALEKLLINSDSEDNDNVDDTSISTLTDITGLDASVQKKLTELFIPKSAVKGENIKKFYQDCKAEGRNLLMMYGHSLIKPETDPDKMYNDSTYE